ncbi:mitochondrial proton/calcium exchanger protein-like isoform X2 [Macrosteles quadrilineatus]|uniref:mitochondrial proton/calcium exchanger protein-like isoform X2 n=1 Tax=Macrosteles quadrilineatus TaxID=74068 RepID=UPI0023E1CFD9|nr:mitochondrial proton/calcium exchanger protein-like isoform X2 [Macrosteles quadrilineatus]
MYLMFPVNILKSSNLVTGCCKCKLTMERNKKLGCLVLNHLHYSTTVPKNILPPIYILNISTQHQNAPFRTCLTSKPEVSVRFSHHQYIRTFQTTSHLFGEPNRPSSKIEETTEAIKEKAKEVLTEKKSDVASAVPSVNKETVIVKKSIGQKIMDEVRHYYHGFKLLFIDIKVSSILVWKVLNGGTLSRREYNLLIRTVGDMFRLVPFSIFIIVPFMELLLPIFIKFFPGMLPSTFQTSTEKANKMKQSLKVKLEMAKFLQQTLDEMAVTSKGHSSKAAKDFVEFFHKVRTEGGGLASNEEILKFSKLFEDEITLDSLTRSQLMALCRVLELQPFGTTNLLRFQLRMKLRSLAADDVRIKDEGVESLTQVELQAACRARGMRALGMSEERLRAQLSQWLDLSLNEKVPPSLLLLSRAFLLPETITTTEKLVATISALPDTVATKTKAAIGEREGKIDNKAQLDLIQEEVAKIQEEKKELEEETKVAEKVEVLVDKAPILTDKATVLADKPKEEKDLSAKDIGETLEDALDAVGKGKKKMIIEKEELDDLKEEMKDYQEDVQNLKEVSELAKQSDEGLEVKESKAAKRLSKTVNKMISKMDAALAELEKKEKAKKESLRKEVTNEESTTPTDELLQVDELIQALQELQNVSDSSRKQTIIEVLAKIDIDKDGVIKVDDLLKTLSDTDVTGPAKCPENPTYDLLSLRESDALKAQYPRNIWTTVVEVIGRENIKLNQKQIDDVIELIKKEEKIEKKEENKNGEPKNGGNEVSDPTASKNVGKKVENSNQKDTKQANESIQKITVVEDFILSTGKETKDKKFDIPLPPTPEEVIPPSSLVSREAVKGTPKAADAKDSLKKS